MGTEVQELRSQLLDVRAELHDLREIAEAALFALVGKKRLQYIVSAEIQREQGGRLKPGTHLFASVSGKGRKVLYKAGIVTLEEVAKRSRDEISAMKGFGPATMRELEKAMANRGLSFAEAA